jgi:hypothetical protein
MDMDDAKSSIEYYTQVRLAVSDITSSHIRADMRAGLVSAIGYLRAVPGLEIHLMSDNFVESSLSACDLPCIWGFPCEQAMSIREKSTSGNKDPQRVKRHLQLLRSKIARAKAQILEHSMGDDLEFQRSDDDGVWACAHS